MKYPDKPLSIRPLMFSSTEFPFYQFAKQFKNSEALKSFFSPFNFLLCLSMATVASIAIGIFSASIGSGLSFFTVGMIFSCCFIEGNFLDQQTYNQVLKQIKENQKNEPPRVLGRNANPQGEKALVRQTHVESKSGTAIHEPTGP